MRLTPEVRVHATRTSFDIHAEPELSDERSRRPRLREDAADAEQSTPVTNHFFERVRVVEVDDAVEERSPELVKELARLDDGRAVGQARGVDEEMGEDLAEDVFRDGSECARTSHGGWWVVAGTREKVVVERQLRARLSRRGRERGCRSAGNVRYVPQIDE